MTSTASPVLVACQRGPQVARRYLVVWLPYAGGTAATFYRWGHAMSRDAGVLSVEYPGHGRRINDRPARSVQEIAVEIVDALQDLLSPYALCGHSMGALIAFECCRELERRGRRLPFALVACAHRAPHLPPRGPLIHDLPEDDFVDRLQALNATPPEVFSSRELTELMLPILRADFQACESYIAPRASTIHVPIFTYGGLEDPDVSQEELGGWRMHTALTWHVRMFAGGHFFLHSDIDRVARTLAVDLAAAARERSIGREGCA
jgi:surfactin synthase thioesterase subunit